MPGFTELHLFSLQIFIRTLKICKHSSKRFTNIDSFKMVTTFGVVTVISTDEKMEAQRGLVNLPRTAELVCGGISAPCNLALSPCP